MGFGKAQKQARNLKIKMDKKRAEQKLRDEEYKKELEMIASMDNNSRYALTKDNGEPVFNGMFANARFWKAFYGLPTE